MNGPATRPRSVEPLDRPPDVDLEVPGSKSVTNRALVAAALARGRSRLTGALLADDTWAMLGALRAVGFELTADGSTDTVIVQGAEGRIPAASGAVDVQLSGTTARFIAPLLALGHGRFDLDGEPPFRRRPMAPVLEAIGYLGAKVTELGAPGHLPVRIDAAGWQRDHVRVAGDASSQFLSGLLLAAPVNPAGLTIDLTTGLVSERYVDLTIATMGDLGAQVSRPTPQRFEVAPTGYTGTDLSIEPDASAATYLLAAAAITGGRVRVRGLTAHARQGDAGFAQVLARMGAAVTVDDRGTEVRGTGTLRGIEVDLGEMSDTAQTLAAVAVFADAPTRITGIGFIRAKETDRIHAMVTELRRCGIRAEAEDDGILIHPGVPIAATIQTYDDHRMAMSFALLGLRVPGIRIADPGCVAKTFPTYFEVLDRLRGPGPSGG